MLNRLQAASRLLVRASLALFTGFVLLLLQSAFWSNRVSGWMQAIIFATALLSYFRPHYGLLMLAALTPLGQVISRTLDSQIRGAEALVLAFLAGALVRGWTLREFRTFPSNRLETVSLIFGFVVAASLAEQIWFLQIRRDFPWTFAQEVLTYASRDYLTTFQGFAMLSDALVLLEGIALLLYTTKYAREQSQFSVHVVVMILAGAVGTAVLTIGYAASRLLATGQVRARLLEFAALRWSVHVGDINAAGSFFAMGMFIALGMALRKGRYRAAWLATSLVLTAATWMTHSRTAIAAVLLMFACIASVATLGRVIGTARTIAITAAASVAVAIALWHVLGPGYFGHDAATAVKVRWLFLGTTARMLLSEPLFGVGIGQYFFFSRQFAAPEMLSYYVRENAHNNFAQVAGELGLVGLAGFLAILIISLWRRGTGDRSSHILVPVVLGLAAFIVTWLGGHPLLVPEVAYPFWLTLGAAASCAIGSAKANLSSGTAGLAVMLLLASVPLRVGVKTAELDLARVSYGISPKQLMTSRARFFVPAGASRVEFPLRARSASENAPVEIEVIVDGSSAATITLRDQNSQKAPISLPNVATRRFHQIDLQIRPGALDDIDAGRSTVEVGKWEIISKPNG